MVDNSTQNMIIIIQLILGFVNTYIIFDFMSKFERVLYYKKHDYVISYLVFTVIIMFISGPLGPFVNFIVSLIGTIIIGHFFYNNKKIYILYYSMFIIMLAAVQLIVGLIFHVMFTNGLIKFYDNQLFILAVGIINQFVTLSVSRLFIVCYKNKNINKLTKGQYFSFLVLPVFSIVYIITLMMYMQNFLGLGDIILFFINIASIIFLNVFITNIFQSISKNNQLKNEIVLYEQQANMQYNYYSALETKYKNSRKVIHDIKNHLLTIENLYKLKEEEKALQYTEDLYKMFNVLEQKYYTFNKVLNIIINDKAETAKSFDIDLECKIGDVDLSFIKDIDLTTIFSNLIDNAIDEVKEFESNKKISIKVDKFNDLLVINITNPLKSKPIKNTETFKTTKKDHKGLGLQNVKMAIEKYEGNLKIDFNEERFKVNIMIPIN